MANIDSKPTTVNNNSPVEPAHTNGGTKEQRTPGVGEHSREAAINVSNNIVLKKGAAIIPQHSLPYMREVGAPAPMQTPAPAPAPPPSAPNAKPITNPNVILKSLTPENPHERTVSSQPGVSAKLNATGELAQAEGGHNLRSSIQAKIGYISQNRDFTIPQLVVLGTGASSEPISSGIKNNLNAKIDTILADDNVKIGVDSLAMQIIVKDNISKDDITDFLETTLDAASKAFGIPDGKEAKLNFITKADFENIDSIEGGYIPGPEGYGYKKTDSALHYNIVVNSNQLSPLMNSKTSAQDRFNALANLVNTVVHENTHHYQSLSIAASANSEPVRKPNTRPSLQMAILSEQGFKLQDALKTLGQTTVQKQLYKNENHELFAHYSGDTAGEKLSELINKKYGALF